MHFFKYHFNPGTHLHYPSGQQMRRGVRFLFYAFGSAVLLTAGLVAVHDVAFEPINTKKIRAENALMARHIPVLQQRLDNADAMLLKLDHADNALHTKLFDSSPAVNPHRKGYDNEQVLLASASDSRSIIHALKERSQSLLSRSARSNAEFGKSLRISRSEVATLHAIPTIQPVDNSQIDLLVSGFGERISPFHKGKYMHTGVDFAAPRGSAVFATAPGLVVTVKKTTLQAGYGNYVEIDHGNGYLTRYAHLDGIDVRRGQRVYKGKVIGSAGNSGGSVAPHLHYEVIKDGTAVDPVNYLLEGLTVSQYDAILHHATVQNQTLD